MFGPPFHPMYDRDDMDDRGTSPRVQFDPKATPEERRAAALDALNTWAKVDTLLRNLLPKSPKPTGRDLYLASCPLPKALGESEVEPYREAANRILHGDALRDRLAGIDRAVSAQLAVCSLTGVRLTEDKAKAYRAAAYANLTPPHLEHRLEEVDRRCHPEPVNLRYRVALPVSLPRTGGEADLYRAAAQAHLVGDALKARLAAIDALLEPEVTEPAPEAPASVEPVAPVAPVTKPARKRRR